MLEMWKSWWSGCNMKKYFVLQLKRIARFLPWGLMVALILFGCMAIAYQAMVTAQASDAEAESAKIRVGIVGTAGDQYMQWGLAAMQFDSSAMSIQMVQLEEQEAVAQLEQGKIAAFVVFPEGFVDEALYGNVQQLRFVSTVGASGLVSIVKEEVTAIVNRILVACESGSFAVGDALSDNGYGQLGGKHINDLALEYVDFLFDRSKMYQVVPMQQDHFVPFDRYMLGGLTVLMLLLTCLAFAPLYIREDLSLTRLLRAQRIGAAGQVLAELGGYGVGLAGLLCAISLVMGWAGVLPEGTSALAFFAGALPTLLMVASFTYLLYVLSDHLVGGVLLTFFGILALSFVGGCMYPIYVFPATVQRLAAVLPTGIARESVVACIQGNGPGRVWALLAYSAGFVGLAVMVRGCKTEKIRG